MQYEFNVARLRVTVFLALLLGLIFFSAYLASQAENVIGFLFGAAVAIFLAWPLTFLIAVLFTPNPILTLTKSEVYYRAGMSRPVPWSACIGIGIAEPDGRISRSWSPRVTISVENIERYAPSRTWFQSVLTGVYPPKHWWFTIWCSGIKGSALDIVRAMVGVGSWHAMLELARALNNWAARYAEPTEVQSLIGRLEKLARTPDKALLLASSLIDGSLPIDTSRAERLVDSAIRQDVAYVRDAVKAAAQFDVLYLDIGRRRLEAQGHDISGLPKVDPADLATVTARVRRGPVPIPKWKRLWAAVKALGFLSLFVLIVAMMIDGIPEARDNWIKGAFGILFSGISLWAFVVDLKFFLGVTRRGTNRY